MKTFNDKAIIIYKYIIENEVVKQADIINNLGFERGYVSRFFKEQVKEGMFIQEERNYSFNSCIYYYALIDLNRDTLTASIHDSLGKCVFKIDDMKFNMSSFGSLLATLEILLQKINSLQKNYNLVNICYSIHGQVYKNKKVVFLPDCELSGFDIEEITKQYIDIPVIVENFANLCALTEKLTYYSKNENLIFIKINESIGGGFVIGDDIFQGFTGRALEVGDIQEFAIAHREIKGSYLELDKFRKELNEIGISKFEEMSTYSDKEKIDQYINQYIYSLVVTIENLNAVIDPQSIIIYNELISNYPLMRNILYNTLFKHNIDVDMVLLSKLPYDKLSLSFCQIVLKKNLGIKLSKLNID